MPRSAEQNEAMRAATRETVLAAAVRLFARCGYPATNMRDIASEAGISTGLIYRHFASKVELFAVLLGQASASLEGTAEVFAEATHPAPQIRGFTQRFLADIADDGGAAEFFMVINHAFSSDEPEGARARLLHAHGDFRGALAGSIRRGQEAGEFAPGDADELARAYLAMLAGVVTMRMAGETVLPTPELVMRVLTGRRTP